MSLTEERMQILRMLESGTINAADAAKLLAALESGSQNVGRTTVRRTAGSPARWLRVRVTDSNSGHSKVSVNLPMGLVNVAVRMGAKFVPEIEDINMEEILEAIENDIPGKIVDVQDQEDGERVEIFIE